MVAVVVWAESQTTTFSQSWRWPRPAEGESLGMYQLYMIPNLPFWVPARAYTWPGDEEHPPFEAPLTARPPLLGYQHSKMFVQSANLPRVTCRVDGGEWNASVEDLKVRLVF